MNTPPQFPQTAPPPPSKSKCRRPESSEESDGPESKPWVSSEPRGRLGMEAGGWVWAAMCLSGRRHRREGTEGRPQMERAGGREGGVSRRGTGALRAHSAGWEVEALANVRPPAEHKPHPRARTQQLQPVHSDKSASLPHTHCWSSTVANLNNESRRKWDTLMEA